MEFLLCFLCGILYAWFVIGTIGLIVLLTYFLFKLLFWVYEKLGIENPVIAIYEFIRNKMTLYFRF